MEFKIKNKEWEEFFSKIGIDEAAASDIVQNAMTLSGLSGYSVFTCIEYLVEIMNKFSKNSFEVISSLGRVYAKSCSSVFDLIHGLYNAPSEDIDIENYLYIINKMKETTGRPGSIIGNSLKTIFSNLKSKNKIEKLRSLGVELEKVDKISLIFLVELIKKVVALDENKRLEAEKLISGLYQINSFKSFCKIFKNA